MLNIQLSHIYALVKNKNNNNEQILECETKIKVNKFTYTTDCLWLPVDYHDNRIDSSTNKVHPPRQPLQPAPLWHSLLKTTGLFFNGYANLYYIYLFLFLFLYFMGFCFLFIYCECNTTKLGIIFILKTWTLLLSMLVRFKDGYSYFKRYVCL